MQFFRNLRLAVCAVLLSAASCGAAPPSQQVAIVTQSTTPPSGLQLLCSYYPAGQFPYTLGSNPLTVPIQCNNQGQLITTATGGGGGAGGSVSVTNFPSTQNVAFPVGSPGLANSNPFYSYITNFPTSQTVNGTVNIGNSSVNVNVGNASIPVTQSGTWLFQLAGLGTASNNPLFMSCTNCSAGGGTTYQYNSVLPTYTSGTSTTPQTDSNGRQLMSFGGIAQPVSLSGSSTVSLNAGSQVSLTGAGTASNNPLYTVATQSGTYAVSQSGAWAVNATIQNGQINTGIGINDNGTGQQVVLCDQSHQINASSSGDLLLISGVANKVVHICGWDFETIDPTLATTVTLEQSSSTSCTSPTALAGPYPTVAGGVSGLSRGGAVGQLYASVTGNSICIKNTAAQQIGGSIQYTVY